MKTAVAGTPFAAFNDDIRDAIRGSVFEPATRGFVLNALAKVKKIKSGAVGSIDFSKTEKGFADDPQQTINYAACHDNHTLWDKNTLAAKADSSYAWTEADLVRAQKLAGAVLMTAQGVAFLHGGQDFCRTKNFDENSYASPISVNGFDYARKAEYLDVFEYYKGLIALRKAFDAFRLRTDEEIRERVRLLTNKERMVVSYIIEAPASDGYRGVPGRFQWQPEGRGGGIARRTVDGPRRRPSRGRGSPLYSGRRARLDARHQRLGDGALNFLARMDSCSVSVKILI